MNIVILNECFLSETQLQELRKENTVISYEVTSNIEDAKERVQDAEIIFVDQFVCPISNEVLDKARNLKLILLNTTSFHLIDQDYLKLRGIALCNTPDFCSDSVGELVFAYILILMRNIICAYKDNVKAPFEIYPDDMSHRKYIGSNLSHKTLGIIGLGNIGQKIAQIAKGFDMEVLGYNRSLKNISSLKEESLDDVLKQSDILVITTPYNSDSHHMINKEKMQFLKKGVVIINISSEEIIEQEALIESLESWNIRGYGLDNFTNKDKNHYFYNTDRVLILPHLGFFSQESLENIGIRMMEAYRGYMNGKNTYRII